MKKLLIAFAVSTLFVSAAYSDDKKVDEKTDKTSVIEKPVKKERNPFESQIKKIEKLTDKRLKTDNTSKRDEITKEIKKEETKLKESVEKMTDKLDKMIERCGKKAETAKDEKTKAAIDAEMEKLKNRRNQIVSWSKESFINQDKDRK